MGWHSAFAHVQTLTPPDSSRAAEQRHRHERRRPRLRAGELRLDVRGRVSSDALHLLEEVALLGQPHRVGQDQPGRGLDMLRTVTAARARRAGRRCTRSVP